MPDCRSRLLFAPCLAAALWAACAPAAAQFIAPPPPPPVLPPTFAPYPGAQYQRPQQFGYRCATQFGVCMLGGPGPVGMGCTCVTPNGYIPGQIIP